jgi:acyl-CoA hydrolase
MPADTVETMIARIDERTGAIMEKINTHCDQLCDHEKRIGGLEGFKMSVYIVSAVLVALAGLVVAAVGVF